MRLTLLAAALVAALPGVVLAQSADGPPAAAGTDGGPALVDGQGMTLYTFARDPDGQTACVAACAVNWPPLVALDGARPEGGFGVIVRPDGARQWTYHDRPLYRWSKDGKPGDATGDGVLEGAWRIARP